MKSDNTLVWIIVGVSVALLFSLFGFSGYGGYGMMSMMGGNYGSGMMFFGWIISILIIALIIAAIYWLIKTANRK